MRKAVRKLRNLLICSVLSGAGNYRKEYFKISWSFFFSSVTIELTTFYINYCLSRFLVVSLCVGKSVNKSVNNFSKGLGLTQSID